MVHTPGGEHRRRLLLPADDHVLVALVRRRRDRERSSMERRRKDSGRSARERSRGGGVVLQGFLTGGPHRSATRRAGRPPAPAPAWKTAAMLDATSPIPATKTARGYNLPCFAYLNVKIRWF